MSGTSTIGLPEVARRLGVSGARVRQFVAEGRLRTERPPGTRIHVVTEREYARFEALHRRNGRPQS